jgi:hypothetical protein
MVPARKSAAAETTTGCHCERFALALSAASSFFPHSAPSANAPNRPYRYNQKSANLKTFARSCLSAMLEPSLLALNSTTAA